MKKLFNLEFLVLNGDEVYYEVLTELTSNEVAIQRKLKLKELQERFGRKDILVDVVELKYLFQAA